MDNTYQQDIEDDKENKHPEISVCHVQASPQTHQWDQGIQVQHHWNLWRTKAKTHFKQTYTLDSLVYLCQPVWRFFSICSRSHIAYREMVWLTWDGLTALCCELAHVNFSTVYNIPCFVKVDEWVCIWSWDWCQRWLAMQVNLLRGS